jgi:hypothetical protein
MLPGDWAASLDLQDAYLHIPVHPDYQHYLQFYFEGLAYQFKAMPFRTGLCSADLSVNRKGVRSTATCARVKTSFLPR